MEIPKTFDAKSAEEKWYAYWMDNGFFRSVPDSREPYTIVIPPPNVTGVLHMGHMLNNTIQDTLVRRARMLGKNALWVPGTDHASIATEAKVVNMLREQGIAKTDLTREKFLEYAFEWKEKYGGIILEQLKKMGASCDWERTRFTMEDDLSAAVIKVFVDLYNKGHVYRGVRMVNWDPQAQTAVSDEEVLPKDTTMRLFHIRYKVADDDSAFVTIATTRPETIMADVAIAVNPTDERHAHLIGKKVLVPIINRAIPVIGDDYVDKEFGTGFLKVTPAHDPNDYEIGLRHKLPVIDILNLDGKLNEKCEVPALTGVDRFTARKEVVKMLTELGQMGEVKEYPGIVNISERTGAVIEPRLSLQWFVKMKALTPPALENVLNGNVNLLPQDKFINTYKHWMENVRDWCISRQLWWGQRIPAYYLPDGEFVVAETAEEALKLAQQKNPAYTAADLKQDEDVVDTWFSSWLWPISVFDGFKNPDNPDFKYYYPTNDLVTAPEILFFWVARMIMAGYEYFGEKPFSNVYLTGIVRDQLGRKMSKQLGNSPDPLDMIDVYTADGMRFGMLYGEQPGNDIIFDTPLEIKTRDDLKSKMCEQGRNFSNKIWNAARLILGWEVADIPQSEVAADAIKWFESCLNQHILLINEHFDNYRISEALRTTYKLVWDDFCAIYLEAVKPDFVDGKSLPVDQQTLAVSIGFMEKLLKLVHPFMPFIAEELWHLLGTREAKDCIIVAPWPVAGAVDNALLARFAHATEVVTNVRNIRQQKNIAPKEKLVLAVKGVAAEDFILPAVIIKLANLSAFGGVSENVAGAIPFVAGTTEYFVPMEGKIDVAAERERLLKDLEYNKGFLQSVAKKLANERFVQNAKPEVIANERQKQADAETKIKAIEEQLQNL